MLLKQSVKLRINVQFIQKWHTSILQGGKCTIYRIIKTTFGFENAFKDLPDNLKKYITKYRCRNHFLPIEAVVRSQVLRDMCVCQFCKTDIGDESRYLFCCVNFKDERKKYIDAKYYLSIYVPQIFKQGKSEQLKEFAIFAKIKICKF